MQWAALLVGLALAVVFLLVSSMVSSWLCLRDSVREVKKWFGQRARNRHAR